MSYVFQGTPISTGPHYSILLGDDGYTYFAPAKHCPRGLNVGDSVMYKTVWHNGRKQACAVKLCTAVDQAAKAKKKQKYEDRKAARKAADALFEEKRDPRFTRTAVIAKAAAVAIAAEKKATAAAIKKVDNHKWLETETAIREATDAASVDLDEIVPEDATEIVADESASRDVDLEATVAALTAQVGALTAQVAALTAPICAAPSWRLILAQEEFMRTTGHI